MTRPNKGSLMIEAIYVSTHIRHPSDLSLLNKARELTMSLIEEMHPQIRNAFGHKPRTHRKQATAVTSRGQEEEA